MEAYQTYAFLLLIIIATAKAFPERIKYEEVDKAPETESKIMTLSNTPEVQLCLASCSKNPDCKSVVYEGTLCHLYETALGSVPLMAGQKAIAEVSREPLVGNVLEGSG